MGATPAELENQPIILTADYDAINYGAIASATKNAGGSGYSVGDTGTIAGNASDGDWDPGPVAATYHVDSVDGGGAVLTFHLTNAGSNYATGSGLATTKTSGAGTGFTVNIGSVNPGDGTVSLTLAYLIVGA